MKRIPVNLATNPIERRQWLQRVTLGTAAAVALLTLAHLALGWILWSAPEAPEPDLSALELIEQWSDEVDELTSASDPDRAYNAAVQTGLSNALIDRRVFSWSALFNALEESMPDDVRLDAVQPVTTLDGVRVSLTAASESGESLLAFLSRLEERPEFLAVYPGRQLLGLDGDLRLTVEALASADSEPVDAGDRGAAEQGDDAQEQGAGEQGGVAQEPGQ